MNDLELDDLIRATQPEPVFPSSFQREVWTRIAAAGTQTSGWKGWADSIFGILARPTPAIALVTLTLAVGAMLGRNATNGAADAKNLESYLVSIDPLRMHDTPSPR
jgi:hypothetical protein